MGMDGQRHVPAALPPGKIRYPLYRRLGGPQGRSGLVRKISTAPGFDPRTVNPVASRCTDWATGARILPLFQLQSADRATQHPPVKNKSYVTQFSQKWQILSPYWGLTVARTAVASKYWNCVHFLFLLSYGWFDGSFETKTRNAKNSERERERVRGAGEMGVGENKGTFIERKKSYDRLNVPEFVAWLVSCTQRKCWISGIYTTPDQIMPQSFNLQQPVEEERQLPLWGAAIRRSVAWQQLCCSEQSKYSYIL